jgi:hypothetical protein
MVTKVATWGPHYWPWFLIAVALAFLIPEIYALITNDANTLTDYSRVSLNVTSGQGFTAHTAAWILTLGMWLVVTGWLTGHIWFDLWS